MLSCFGPVSSQLQRPQVGLDLSPYVLDQRAYLNRTNVCWIKQPVDRRDLPSHKKQRVFVFSLSEQERLPPSANNLWSPLPCQAWVHEGLGEWWTRRTRASASLTREYPCLASRSTPDPSVAKLKASLTSLTEARSQIFVGRSAILPTANSCNADGLVRTSNVESGKRHAPVISFVDSCRAFCEISQESCLQVTRNTFKGRSDTRERGPWRTLVLRRLCARPRLWHTDPDFLCSAVTLATRYERKHVT